MSGPSSIYNVTYEPKFDGIEKQRGLKRVFPNGQKGKTTNKTSFYFDVPPTKPKEAYDLSRAYFHINVKFTNPSYTVDTATTYAALVNNGYRLFDSYTETIGDITLVNYDGNFAATEFERMMLMENNQEDLDRINRKYWFYDPITEDITDDGSHFRTRAAICAANTTVSLKLPLLKGGFADRSLPLLLPSAKSSKTSGLAFELEKADLTTVIQTPADFALKTGVTNGPEVDISQITLVIPTITSAGFVISGELKSVGEKSAAQTIPMRGVTYYKYKTFESDGSDGTDGSSENVALELKGVRGNLRSVLIAIKSNTTNRIIQDVIKNVEITYGDDEYPTKEMLPCKDDAKIDRTGTKNNLIEYHELGFGDADYANSTYFTYENWMENYQLFRIPINNYYDEIQPLNKLADMNLSIDMSGLTEGAKYRLLVGLEIDGLVKLEIQPNATDAMEIVKKTVFNQRTKNTD